MLYRYAAAREGNLSATTIPNFSTLHPNRQNGGFAENIAINFETLHFERVKGNVL